MDKKKSINHKSQSKTHFSNPSVSDPWLDISSKYALKEMLGEGTFGEVRKAKCLSTGNTVAIKLIKKAFESTYEARKIVREIEIL